LADVVGVVRRSRRRDAVFVSYPLDHTQAKRFSRRALFALCAQQADDFVVMMVDRQLSDARDEGLRVADRLGAVWRQLQFQGFYCSALPTDV
jgi:hypothetical protein